MGNSSSKSKSSRISLRPLLPAGSHHPCFSDPHWLFYYLASRQYAISKERSSFDTNNISEKEIKTFINKYSAISPQNLIKQANIRPFIEYRTLSGWNNADCIDNKNYSPPKFLSWNKVKHLHKIYPFTFQFATGLRITLQSRYEADEFFSSEAAKFLFHQLEHLALDCRYQLIRNDGSLVHFIQQFLLLKSCHLLFHGRYGWNVIMKIFQEIFSSTLIVRNHALTMSLVNSFEMWYMHDIDFSSWGPLEKEAFCDGGILYVLINLMCDFFKQDDGRSFITFLDAFAKMIPTSLDFDFSATDCDRVLYTRILPLLDLLQQIISNRDFKRIALRSHSEKPFLAESTTSPLDDQVELKAAEGVLRVVNWVLKSKDTEHVLMPFVQNYGHSFLCEFPRVVLDTSKDQSGEVYSYFSDAAKHIRKKIDYLRDDEKKYRKKIDFFNKINRLMWLQFLHLVKNHQDNPCVKKVRSNSALISLLTDTLRQTSSSSSSPRGSDSSATLFSPEKANDEQIVTACLELFRCKALHDLVDFSASAASMPVSRLIEVLMHTLDSMLSSSSPSSSPSAFLRAHATEEELSHIAKMSLECLLRFTPCKEFDYDDELGSDNGYTTVFTKVWGDLLSGLHMILFGWDRSAKPFHMRIRQCFFGTENFDVVDKFLEWGETVHARSRAMLSDYEDDEVVAMTRRIIKWEEYFHDRVNSFLVFVEGIVMPFFKKLSLEVVQAGDHFPQTNNNSNNNNKLPRLTPSTKEKAARVASVTNLLKRFKEERREFKRINDECVEENQYHPGSGAV